jgi:hypothetical protein
MKSPAGSGDRPVGAGFGAVALAARVMLDGGRALRHVAPAADRDASTLQDEDD